MATGNRNDAFGAYYFRVDLMIDKKFGDTESLPFRSCSGLKSESAVVELEEGGFNNTTRKLIGRTKFPNIVLKQGFCSSSSALWKMRSFYMNDSPNAAATNGGDMGKNR